MPGFNYGGGVGDGTNWSSERGKEPSPGGGSTGHSGDRDSNGKGSGGNGGRSQLSSYSPISKYVGDEAAKASGLAPGLYVGYIVDDYGNVVGVFPVGEDNANGQDLGPLSALHNNGGLVKNAPLQGPGAGYIGDLSDARIAQLRKIIRDNYRLAHSTQSGRRMTNAKLATLKAQYELAAIYYSRQQKAQEAVDLQEGIKLTAAFYKEVTEKFGQRAAALAQELATQAKGKTIRNVNQALAAYERYRKSLGAKFSASDRTAIINALNSVDQARMASQLSKMSKAFDFYGKAADIFGLFLEFRKAFETNNWRPLFVKIEALTASRAASALTAFAFSVIFGSPLGIIGFALIMALLGAFINEKLMESINSRLGI